MDELTKAQVMHLPTCEPSTMRCVLCCCAFASCCLVISCSFMACQSIERSFLYRQRSPHLSPQLRKDMEKQASRAAKLGDRHNLITNGLQQRADKLVDSISTANAALIAADMELRCFETLQEQVG